MTTTVTAYACNICGQTYDDEAGAAACEAQGTRSRFQVGEAVWIFVETKIRRARVVEIRYQKPTESDEGLVHSPIYGLSIGHSSHVTETCYEEELFASPEEAELALLPTDPEEL